MFANKLAVLIGMFGSVVPVHSFADSQSGSGFAITQGGLILTNNHVVDGCRTVSISGGGTAKIIKSDPASDLAILKPSQPLEKGLSFRSGRQVRLGEEIIVIGYPLRGVLASPPTVTTGIVSSLAGIQDDRTRMQISAPVQRGNSGGPVLDRAGNVVGVVVSKLNAIRSAQITGDIPQNVNFAVHATIVTSLLDSYSLDYATSAYDAEKSVSEIVAQALPSVIPIECQIEDSPAPVASAPPASGRPSEPAAHKTATLCGREVDYVPNDTTTGQTSSRFLGVWRGIWNTPTRLCGGLIVEKVLTDGTAEVIYVYGPSRVNTAVNWKRQHLVGMIRSDGKLSFRDDQGSTFVFDMEGNRLLNAIFGGASGRLNGVFERGTD
jgi:hypothetical protein